jgi:F0F1-type ATP synthase assembly protein I
MKVTPHYGFILPHLTEEYCVAFGVGIYAGYVAGAFNGTFGWESPAYPDNVGLIIFTVLNFLAALTTIDRIADRITSGGK